MADSIPSSPTVPDTPARGGPPPGPRPACSPARRRSLRRPPRRNPYRVPRPAVVSFSGGRTSGYLLKHVLDAYGGQLPGDVSVVFANTGMERPETLDFVDTCACARRRHTGTDPPGASCGLFVDCETTGADWARDVVVELALLPFTTPSARWGTRGVGQGRNTEGATPGGHPRDGRTRRRTPARPHRRPTTPPASAGCEPRVRARRRTRAVGRRNAGSGPTTRRRCPASPRTRGGRRARPGCSRGAPPHDQAGRAAAQPATAEPIVVRRWRREAVGGSGRRHRSLADGVGRPRVDRPRRADRPR